MWEVRAYAAASEPFRLKRGCPFWSVSLKSAYTNWRQSGSWYGARRPPSTSQVPSGPHSSRRRLRSSSAPIRPPVPPSPTKSMGW